MSSALTPKQEKFCQAIVQGYNQSEAYRLAYGVKNATAKTINERASRLMGNSKVVARVAELRAPVIQQVQDEYARWLQDIQRCAFFDVRRLFDSHGRPIEIPDLPDDVAPAIAGFEFRENFIGKKDKNRVVCGYTRKYRLTNRLEALVELGKALGWYGEKTKTGFRGQLDQQGEGQSIAVEFVDAK